MKINMGYLSVAEETKVIAEQKVRHPIETLTPVMDLEKVMELQKAVKNIETSAHVLRYIVELVSATRNKEDVKLGASPRASIALMKASCAWALLEGRDYTIPDDVAVMLPYVLRHRLILQPKALIAGKNTEAVISELAKSTPVP